MRLPARLRRLSKRGVHFIAAWEGFRSHPYNDAAGYATVGYGHLIRYGSVRASDRPITPAQGLKLLAKDASGAVACVRKHVKVPLSQHAFDALVSFVFNLGCGALEESTLLRLLNRRDYRGAAAEFEKWDMAGGHVLEGLQHRREAERDLFWRGAY